MEAVVVVQLLVFGVVQALILKAASHTVLSVKIECMNAADGARHVSMFYAWRMHGCLQNL
jgi:hypothetical protein